ncbi:MAG: MATE family efflux transporter [Gemmatimonadetes bacterium]|nr:MATE family efflux transporter [Gemmatimonadota bacterium]MYB99107.1 MATE family efflux transporter [Gemmatimonadota bacterium]MYI47398.1 MATE family efflux transporter [Gemmatimonadota bacterium]
MTRLDEDHKHGTNDAPDPSTRQSAETWWDTFLHAVRGTGGDPTSGPLRRAVILLAIPMVLEMVMESLFAVVDIYFVSKLGDHAMAGVALTESGITIIYTLAAGLSIGVTAMVARRVGEGDRDGAARAAAQAIFVGVFVALVFGVCGVVFAADILRVMGADPEVVAVGLPYTRIMFGGNIVILLLFLQNAAFRGAGDAAIAMRVLWIANGLNIVLDPLLIFGVGPFPELGVKGAAIATTIGRGVAVLVQLYTLLRLGGTLRIRRPHLRLQPAIMARLVRLSATGTLQTFIATASWIGLIRVTAEFGAEALAGYVIAIRIILFAILPAWGLSNAAATMVGQGLGAGDPDRAERAVWISCKLNLAFLGAVGVLFLVFAPQIVSIFGGTGAATATAVDGLRIVSIGFVFYAYAMVLTSAFNGAGAVWTPTILNFFCFWLWEIPLAWTLAFPFAMGPNGVFIAMTVSFSTLAVVSAILFRRGRWKQASV